MNAAEVDRGFDFLVESSPHKGEMRQVVAAVRQALETDSSGNLVFPAVEKAIGEKRGYAFQWADIVDIGVIAEALLGGVAAGTLLPNQLATVIVSLLKFWQQLRKVRVELSENEYKVLIAVKRGNSDVSSISKYTGLPDVTVNDVVAALKNREYQERVYLLEVGDQGQIATQF
jgi:hypothetical protein